MTETNDPSSKRALEPIERISEVLFGVIMVLTFTGSLSVADAGRAGVRGMLLSALGCNLAWGIIDAFMYLMGCLAEKGRALAAFRAARKAAEPEKAHRIIARSLPPLIASMLKPPEFESLRQQLCQLAEPPVRPRLHKKDWLGAIAVFLLVFLSTLPVVTPFLFMHNPLVALRCSNGIAIVMLFGLGYGFGRCAGFQPWVMGIAMVVIGGVLVTITMALGG